MTRLWLQGKLIEVTIGDDGILHRFRCFGHWWQVTEVCNRWCIRQGWWKEGGECWRDYLKVLTGEGMLCLLFYDHRKDAWFLERVYD